MSCTLATLKLCLSLSGIYVDSGLEYHDVGEWRSQYETFDTQHNGVHETGGTWRSVNSPQNAYGRIGLGYEAQIDFGHSKVLLNAGWWHDSSISSGNDRGVNSFGIGAKFFPFARAD